jgi:hypothetical protein
MITAPGLTRNCLSSNDKPVSSNAKVRLDNNVHFVLSVGWLRRRSEPASC